MISGWWWVGLGVSAGATVALAVVDCALRAEHRAVCRAAESVDRARAAVGGH